MASNKTAELVVCEMARLFGPEDDFIVASANNSGLVGIVLAQELYAPRISFYMAAKGKGAFLKHARFPFIIGKPPERFIETLVDMEEIFEAVGRGKYSMIMQPVQIDKYGYMNLSLVGDINRPHRVFVGSRGVPDNTVNSPRITYFVPNHTPRVFVEKVDFISGIGYGPERREGTIPWGAPSRVITNLCTLDFDEDTGEMQLRSVHPGVSADEVKKNTGFDLRIPDPVAETDSPTDEELHWINEIIDPSGISRLDFLKGEDHQRVLSEIMRGTTYQRLYKK